MVVDCPKALPAEDEDLADVGGSWSRPIGGVRVWPLDSK